MGSLLYWKWESNSTTVYYYHVTSPPFLHRLPQPHLHLIPPVLRGCPGQDGHQLQDRCPPLPQCNQINIHDRATLIFFTGLPHICGHAGIRVGTAPLILPTAACPGLLRLLGAERGHQPEEPAPPPSKYDSVNACKP